MLASRVKLALVVSGGIILLIVAWAVLGGIERSQYYGVDQLWDLYYQRRVLDGDYIVIRGEPVFDPHASHGFNLYLVDSSTSAGDRHPDFAIWFGVGIDELECQEEGAGVVCRPFDPSQADAFMLKGILHLAPAGKRPVMLLSDIDFEQSRQFISGSWQPIPLGEFEIPIE